jgi:hypothetical protein
MPVSGRNGYATHTRLVKSMPDSGLPNNNRFSFLGGVIKNSCIWGSVCVICALIFLDFATVRP